MSDCCAAKSGNGTASGAEDNASGQCPQCSAKGTIVDRVTLMALLTPAARGRLNQRGYRFCPSSGCNVVYFGEQDRFTRADVNVRVGQKETDPTRTVCYCFNHTVQSIIDEIASTGKSTAVESIKAEIKAKRCACEVTNPQGTCCLGNVTQAVRSVLKAENRQAEIDARL